MEKQSSDTDFFTKSEKKFKEDAHKRFLEKNADGTDRIVEIGTQRFGYIKSVDRVAYGAHNEYHIISNDGHTWAEILFQRGPVGKVDSNGCHNEDLIAIVIDRLRFFQKGDLGCRENAIAITKLEEALHWLNARTQDRQIREVEGTSKP